jgi:hypothetical protein
MYLFLAKIMVMMMMVKHWIYQKKSTSRIAIIEFSFILSFFQILKDEYWEMRYEFWLKIRIQQNFHKISSISKTFSQNLTSLNHKIQKYHDIFVMRMLLRKNNLSKMEKQILRPDAIHNSIATSLHVMHEKFIILILVQYYISCVSKLLW